MYYEFPTIKPDQSRFFLLSKPNNGTEILDIHHDQIHYINQPMIMLIPREYITHHSLYGIYESSLMTWIQQEFASKNKIFLDIGAHTGTFTVCLARSFQQVYAFEPQKMTYYALCGSVALSGLDNVTCVNSALGSYDQVSHSNGICTLYKNSADGGTSSLHLSSLQSSNNSSDGIDPGNPIIHKDTITTENVKLCVLDKYINVFSGNVGVIKIDTEENELDILMGSIDVLNDSNLPHIFFEANSNKLQEITDFLVKVVGYNSIIPIRSYKNMYLASK
jgi:FkbM family methyltransferase